MSRQSPHPEGLDDARLRIYGESVRQMRRGGFAVALPVTAGGDAVAVLGQELQELARWLERQFAAFEKLQDLSDHVSSGVLLEDVLDRVFVGFRGLLPYNRLGCALLSNDRQRVVARWARTDYPEPRIRPGYTGRLAGSTLAGILESGQPRIINDLESYAAEHPASQSSALAVKEGIRSSLTCPLISDGAPVGFLFFSSFEKHTYAQVHQQLYLRVAGQLSALVGKSQLYQRILDLNADLAAARDDAKRRADTDDLTGLRHRRSITEAVLAGGGLTTATRATAVLMIDIDNFKHVNDTYGHAAGDAVLCTVAGTLRAGVQRCDAVGRHGGDEFLVVLPRAGRADALRLADQLRSDVAAASTRPDAAAPAIVVTISCGVAFWRDGDTAETVLARADQELYAAKDAGRNCVRAPAE